MVVTESMQFWGGVEYVTRPEGELRLDVLAPSGAQGRPVVLYLHGGGWHEGDRGAGMHPWLNPLLARAGFVCASATYRLSGLAPWPAQIDDAVAAVDWLAENAGRFGGDPERIGVYGFSAGAHLAALAALRPGTRVRAAALAAAPTDLRDIDPGDPGEVTKLFRGRPTPEQLAGLSPVMHVHPAAPPMVIAHGSDDRVVPVGQGIALRDALREAGVTVEWHGIAGAGHEWADRPAAGLDESPAGFGGLVRDFFFRTLAAR